MVAELVKRPDFHWRSRTGLLRQRPQAACGWLRVASGLLPIAGGWLQVAFALPLTLVAQSRSAAASAHGRHVPFAEPANSRPFVLPRGDDVLPLALAVPVQSETHDVAHDRQRKQCSHQYRALHIR